MRAPQTRRVILTGAAGGIGAATARRLAADGFVVGLIDSAVDRLDALAGELNGRFAIRGADVRDEAALAEAVREIELANGPTDVLIAAAGIGRLASIHDLDLAGVRLMLEVNVLGVANAIAAVLPGMIERERGHVVGVSSVAGYRGLPWMPGYSASKAAVSAYLEGLRPPLKRRGIAVTDVKPGFVRTPMTEDTPFRRPVRMLEPDDAAREIVRAVKKRPRDHVFPFSTRVGMGWLRRMPNWCFDGAMDRFGPEALDFPY